MRFTFLLSLLALCSSSLKDCSIGSHTGHIQDITMEPSAPVAGEYVIVRMDYILDSAVTGGSATYTASFNGFPLTPTTQSLCPDVESSTPCPIEAGPVHYENIFQIGDGATHGTVDVTTTWRDQDGLEILCWGFIVRI